MKANEAPESLYFAANKDLIGLYDSTILEMFSEKTTETAIEYIRKDAFIEKAADYIANNMRCNGYTLQTKTKFIRDFKKYMEGDKV